jgi:predicted sulfurtransferase
VVTNISAYRFAPLDGLKSLRAGLMEACQRGGLKGTILLSTEGINLFVAGPAAAIDSLLEVVRAVPGLEGLEPKVSESLEQPFSRMLVRIKKEIIAFRNHHISGGIVTSHKPEETGRVLFICYELMQISGKRVHVNTNCAPCDITCKGINC